MLKFLVPGQYLQSYLHLGKGKLTLYHFYSKLN